MTAFSTVKVYSIRVRLPSGRTGVTAVLANNYTTASELASFQFPGMVLTMPILEGDLGITAQPEDERVNDG